MHQSPVDSFGVRHSVNALNHAAATTNGSGVDLQGYDGVMFVMAAGAVTATLDLKAQESDALASGYADVTGAALTQIAPGGANKSYVLDVYRPNKRFVRPVVTGGATNAFASVVAVLYRRTGREDANSGLGEVVRVKVN